MENSYNSKPAKILNITKHTQVEWSFLLETTIEYTPGQFVFVSLPHVSEIPITISGFRKNAIEITVRNVGTVTSELFKLKVGDAIYYRGPYGELFPLDQYDNEHLLLIAGGSGMAAVKSLVEYYLEYSLKNNKPKLKKLDLVVGFRTPKHVLYAKELKKWGKNSDVIVTVDKHEDEDESWLGGVGFVVDFIKDIQDLGRNSRVVVVGPPVMMTNTVRELLSYNIQEKNIWLSFERHMKCGIGKCGHCRIRDKYVCLDGPVFNYIEAKSLID
ncbi:MAG: anaerobic sulfite reductase subunit AsrB [Leptospirales bacterium]